MKYLIVGYGGTKNKGCEALLETTLKQIKSADKGAYIIVAVFEYETDKNKYLDIVDKYIVHNNKDIIDEIDNIDIILSIGGDNYSEGYVEYLGIIRKTANLKGKKIVGWGLSIQEDINDAKLIEDLRNFDLLIARESLTYKAIKQVVDFRRVLLLPDPAFGLEFQPFKLPFSFKRGDYVCLNVSDIIIKNNNHSFKDVCVLINYIINKYSLNIVLLPHVYSNAWNDLETLKNIKKEFKKNNKVHLLDEKEYSCNELKYIVSNSKALVAARTHASIAGYSSCIPTLVLGYSVKSKGIAYDLLKNYEDFVIPMDILNEEILIEKFDLLMKNYNKILVTLNEKIPDYIRKSKSLAEVLIQKIEEFEIYPTDEKKCSGCGACFNICPFKAIEMQKNNEGFSYPIIDFNKCKKCGKCKIICPVNNMIIKNFKPLIYACQNKEHKILKNSSSGGMFYLFAKLVLDQNGIVYGASYENKIIKHIKIDNEKDLIKVMGSKYVESITYNLFKSIKEELNKSRLVLFSGTPCQVSGLKFFLQKDYSNLITISFICHGVPSPLVFEDYLNNLERKYNEQIKNVLFRDKVYGWKEYSFKVEFENNVFREKHYQNSFFIGFLNNYYNRYSCYNCAFKFNNNISDIILSDLWGIEDLKIDINYFKGVSGLIINSKKGKKLFSLLKNKFIYEKINEKRIQESNPCLLKSINLNDYRYSFFKEYNSFNLNLINCKYLTAKKLEKLNSDINFLTQKNEKEISKLNSDINSLIQKNENEKKMLKNKFYISLENLEREKNLLEKELNKIINSRSWKVTKPLRKISKYINNEK